MDLESKNASQNGDRTEAKRGRSYDRTPSAHTQNAHTQPRSVRQSSAERLVRTTWPALVCGLSPLTMSSALDDLKSQTASVKLIYNTTAGGGGLRTCCARGPPPPCEAGGQTCVEKDSCITGRSHDRAARTNTLSASLSYRCRVTASLGASCVALGAAWGLLGRSWVVVWRS